MPFRNARETTGPKPRDRTEQYATKQRTLAVRRDPSERTSHNKGLPGRVGRRRKGRGAFAGSVAVSPALERTFHRSIARRNANDAQMTSCLDDRAACPKSRSLCASTRCLRDMGATGHMAKLGGQNGAATLLRMAARHRARLAILRREQGRCEPHRGAAGGGAQ